MKLTKALFICAALPLLAASCSEEDYKVYDTTQKDSVFFEYRNLKNEIDTMVNYSFGYDIANVHTVEIPVKLMGMPVDRERVIKIETVAAETDMVEGTHYTVSDNIIPAGQVEGVVKVNLLRDKDTQIQSQAKHLKITIGENDDLRSVGKNVIVINYDDIRPTKRPAWWPTYSPLPVWSFENTQLFFDYFYRLAPKANPAIFEEMVNAYGDYFVKGGSTKGPIVMYGNFIRNYVCIPLADEHPEIEWQEDPHW